MPPIVVLIIVQCYLNIRIQEIDGGFFEKFGSLFRENAELAISREKEEKEDVAIAAAACSEESDVVPPETEIEADRISSSSDSETNDQKDTTEIISTALNVSIHL